MTIVLEALLALIAAAVLVAFMGGVLNRRGPWDGLVWFALVVFLGAWAVGVWVEPVGPLVGRVAILPIVGAAVLIALALAAIPVRRRGPPPPREPGLGPSPGGVAGTVFWALVVMLLVSLGVGYWRMG